MLVHKIYRKYVTDMQKAEQRINMKKYIQRHIALSGSKYERQWRRVCFFLVRKENYDRY
jgi:hypothetical protein